MTTGQRSIAVAAAAGVLAAAAVYLLAERSRVSALEDTLATFAGGPEFSDFRSRCQTDPAHLGPFAASGPSHDGPLIEVYAYDGQFRPADPAAPAFSNDLADRMVGKITALDRYRSPDGAGVELGVATPWRNGPCALMLLRLPPRSGEVANEEIRAGAAGLVAALAIWIGAAMLARRRQR